MQAIILAAGMGNRLGKYTKSNTKCMLTIHGRTLAERALDALNEAGIFSCVMVVGYQKDNVKAALGDHYKNVCIHYVDNDIYDKTNNIYSLYLAKDYLLQDDTLLLESDLIFEPRLIADMLADPEPTIAAVARYESWMDGTVVQLVGDNLISAFIPKKFFDYDEKETYYKTVNIYKFSKDFMRDIYLPFLEAYSHAMGKNEYYEQVLRIITCLDKQDLKAFVLTGQKWYEIDDAQDKAIAETIFAPTPAERLNLIQRAYGGYWRYPGMLDYCYLVNPYFPPPQMQHEMKAYFAELLASYPSGLNTENLLAAKLFNLEDDCILVGNGAAELIRAIAPLVSGSKIGISYPSFNEYTESFPDSEIVPFLPPDFAYTVADLIELSKKCDTVLLINPDNPSGNFIAAADVVKLADILKADNKRLILDESFVDFADTVENSSLLQQEFLDTHLNVIVVKSLSKSYGVPGIRLGVLACGDRAAITEVRRHLSIWNINSFAECFLQIIGKYQKNYVEACRLIKQERAHFKKGLDTLGSLWVYPSEANYFLCKLKNGPAKDLAEDLLGNYNIFIKDLTGKKGIAGESCIRLAVRDRADNDKLLTVLGKTAKHHS